MKAYKVEILIIDFEDLGPDEITLEIENTSYANDCISPSVMNIEFRDIGEWSNDHPLNDCVTFKKEYERLFNEKAVPTSEPSEK